MLRRAWPRPDALRACACRPRPQLDTIPEFKTALDAEHSLQSETVVRNELRVAIQAQSRKWLLLALKKAEELAVQCPEADEVG
jgi:hypothetical protein